MARKHNSFVLNGREIKFVEVLNSSKAIKLITDFEKETVDVIKSFLSEDEKIIQQTSGSTGIPKKIEITREQLIASANMTGEFLGYNNSNLESLLCIPASFIGGKMVLIRALVFDLPIIAQEPSANPFKSIGKLEITSITPYQLQNIIENNSTTCINKNSIILVGGGPVNSELHKKIENLPGKIYHTYAMTETVSNIALRKLNNPGSKDYFEVLEGIEINTSNEQLQVKGKVTSDKWLNTNDVVELINDKSFRWIGRSDNVINSGGIKVNLDELKAKIEAELKHLEISTEVALLKTEDEKFTEGFILVVEENQGNKIRKTIEGIKEKLFNKVKPKKIISIPNLPKTPTDKIDYPTLRKILE
ncbi:AMP-binding protein [Marinigracilibium pacificum]|uniref:AMP-binding protein n=1 Tax=Marinigracilibium pacificum TaxID=2729599 RepID=A0A848IUD2_9BACT|nr:AMP-binding protein [Marinigracilibium pacificum]NMM48113.1 AMP-binding protein [Marinigracilibium pacificum]